MLIRDDKPADRTSDEKLACIFQRHLADTEKWMKSCSYVHSIDVDYNEVIVDPLPRIKLIQEFLGFDLNKDAMLQVIDYSLYREKIRIQ